MERIKLLNNLPVKKFIIVGSLALGTRYAKDIDIICYADDVELGPEEIGGNEWIWNFTWEGKKVECLIADNQLSLQEILKEELEMENNKGVACFEHLFALKAGHIIFPHRQWEKHIHDYHTLKAILKADDSFHENSLYIQELIKLHRKETAKHQRARTPKLKGVTKEQFFDDNVKKYYHHDSLHYAMAHKERPMYEYMQEDTSKVECSKALWDKFSVEEKNMCVMEEAYVIALERHLIPTMKGDRVGLSIHDSFKWALMRICTNLCSGWFREWSINNYFTILNNYNIDYPAVFLKNIVKYENNLETSEK